MFPKNVLSKVSMLQWTNWLNDLPLSGSNTTSFIFVLPLCCRRITRTGLIVMIINLKQSVRKNPVGAVYSTKESTGGILTNFGARCSQVQVSGVLILF